MDNMDRQVVDLELDMFVLKPNTFLVLPETPNIYLSSEKAEKFANELLEAAKHSKEGIIVRFKGEVNPKQDKEGRDESMFLTRELSAKELAGNN